MYRILLNGCWYCELLDTENPQYLFWDDTLERYRVGCRITAAKHKWEFTEDEVAKLRDEHPDFDTTFDVFKEVDL